MKKTYTITKTVYLMQIFLINFGQLMVKHWLDRKILITM